mgnify:CR=1 FL=1
MGMKKVREIIQEKAKVKRQANVVEAQEVAEKRSKWLLEKVENYIERFSLDDSVEDILVKIKEDYLFAATFAKDPNKQNIAETIQLEELSKYCEVKKLSNSGKNALYISSDKVNSTKGKTKSLDAIINDTYCSLKYTNADGGAQDNQRKDIELFLDAAKTCKEDFAAIVDGIHWEKHLPELISEYAEYDNLWIGTSDEWIEENSKRAV